MKGNDINNKKEDILKKRKEKKNEIYTNLESEISSNLFSYSLLVHFFIIFIKILVGQYGYSGENTPPKYGDFEAQRHWMEITLNLPCYEWYTNSKINQEKYWPLDYPPLSGYHSYILSKILNIFIPDSVELKYSHGYESPIFKIVMRFFVLFGDFFIFQLSLNLLCYKIFISDKIKKKKKPLYVEYIIFLLLILLNPLMIIIDHGHFQYNNIMLGFFVFSLYFLLSDKYFLSILFLSFCVNFKQMGLYYAIIFPIYVIKKLFFSENLKNIKQYLISILCIIFYAVITLLINFVIYYPWIKYNKLTDVFSRIFPFKRGIFEDKVATFWCVINIFIKLNKIFEIKNLIKLSLIFTVLGCSIPIYAILKSKKITKKICIHCIFIVAFSFYLFSFHVHEKTIIIPVLPFLLNMPYMINILPLFTLISMFSLFPLLQRENQVISYYILNIIFYIIAKFGIKFISKEKEHKYKNIFLLGEIFSFIMIILYHFIEYKIPPPEIYPWLYPRINATLSFSFFFELFLYSNYTLIKMINKDKNNFIEIKLKDD